MEDGGVGRWFIASTVGLIGAVASYAVWQLADCPVAGWVGVGFAILCAVGLAGERRRMP